MLERLELEPGSCDGRCPNPISLGYPFRVLVEEKLDGHRALLHINKDFDRAYLTSRRISKKTNMYAENGLNVPHIISCANDVITNLGWGYTVLDGELIIPGFKFEDVQSVTGSLSDVAIAWQKVNAPAVLKVFDALYVNGFDVRYRSLEYRKSLLTEVISSIDSKFIEQVPHSIIKDPAIIQNMYESVLLKGGEGLIIKDPGGPYGKRWTKIKKLGTYDVVIIGYQEGSGKYREMIGAVRFGIYKNGKLVEVGKCSGMDDGDVRWITAGGVSGTPNRDGSWIIPISNDQPEGSRAWFSLNRDKLLGTVIEVKGNGLTAHGKIRHPRYVRLRPDKAPQMCNQLKE